MTPDYAALLAAIQRDPRYQENLGWGEPRPGHPEGTVQAHIAELERNLAALQPMLGAEEIGRIRLLIHTHDTFKAQAARGVPIAHPRSHASLAKAFLTEFIGDQDLLTMVQLHDEPYALWRSVHLDGRKLNPSRLSALLTAIDDWDTFLAFQIVDNVAPGKDREPLRWLFCQATGAVATRIVLDEALAALGGSTSAS